MHHRSLLLLLSLLLSATAHAQLYKSVGPDGKVTYSDTPPPAKTGKVQEKNLSNAAPSTQFPFELADASRKHPVTLYTATNCAACDRGREALNARGVPFTEKTVQTEADVVSLKQAGGDQELPLLKVGNKKQIGYAPDTWAQLLTTAGYPVNSQLPRTYRNQAPQPAAPAAAATKASTSATEPAASDSERFAERPAATGNAPPGFRF